MSENELLEWILPVLGSLNRMCYGISSKKPSPNEICCFHNPPSGPHAFLNKPIFERNFVIQPIHRYISRSGGDTNKRKKHGGGAGGA